MLKKFHLPSFLLGCFVGLFLIFVLLTLSSLMINKFCNIGIFWEMTGSLATITATIGAIYFAYKNRLFDITPNVLASGTFIISIDNKEINKDKTTNEIRDDEIDEKSSIHTFQLINLGRGVAKNVVPSIRQDIEGNFLEDVCPHSYALPPGKSTKDFGEILRVHGQRFKKGKRAETIEVKTEKRDERKIKAGWFYIDFKDYAGKQYITKVKIHKVENADGRLEELRKTPGIEIWKVMDNKPYNNCEAST